MAAVRAGSLEGRWGGGYTGTLAGRGRGRGRGSNRPMAAGGSQLPLADVPVVHTVVHVQHSVALCIALTS